VVNLLNPKTAIFFLVFLPQFIDPMRGALPWQFLILSLTFMGLGIVSNGCLLWWRALRVISSAVTGGTFVASAGSQAPRSLALGSPRHCRPRQLRSSKSK
jgi:threonine/homoserine/homoserine lactone efflux protein